MTTDQTHRLSTQRSVLDRACQKYATRPLATFQNETLTYGEAWDKGGRLARGLSQLGLEKGDRVGLLMSNQLGYVTADLACVRGGFVKVAMNDMLTTEEYRHIVSNSGAKAVVVGETFVDTVAELHPVVKTLEHVVVLSETAPARMRAADDLIEHHAAEDLDVSVEPDDISLFQYTGGTTGKPKGAKHAQFGLAMNLHAHVVELDIRYCEEMLLMTPLPHSAGYALQAGMLRGAHVTITQGFNPGDFLTLVEDRAVTWSWMVPTMIYRVLDHERLTDTDTSSLETLVYGAAPITRERLEEGLAAFGQVFLQLYGQSEVPNVGTTLPKIDHTADAGEKLDSCGRSATMVDVRITNRDDETDTSPLPTNEVGEILLRAPYGMTGYHDLTARTDSTVVDRWIRTGDVGRMDEEGYVYVLDRDSDVIVSGGMNVYTTNVEVALGEHPKVRSVAVIAVPHDDWGEAVHAVVVPREGRTLTERELATFSDDCLADYKRPKSIEFRDELPTTPYGKVDKKALREPHWEDHPRDVA